MSSPLRLMAVLAHPDDEALGLGGTFAKYAREGTETYLVTATLGEAGRFRGIRPGEPGHPGPDALGRIREAELHASAAVLGLREVSLLGYRDQMLDRADPLEAIGRIAAHLRRVRPHVVITFPPDGSYGHPDHIAICQFATAAVVAAADPEFSAPGPSLPTHAVSKLYYIAMPQEAMAAYESAFRKMIARVDGVDREPTAWPSWALTCVISTRAHWETVWRAASCHESQITAYEALRNLSPEHHEALWGLQSFYRAFSTVNGGRTRESDLFEGLRELKPTSRVPRGAS